MNDREAIDVLFNEWKCVDRNDGLHCDRKCENCDLVMDTETIREAYNLAITALEARRQGVTSECGDVISRQAEIDAIFSEPLYESGMKKKDADAVVPAIYDKIKSLPSVQPDAPDIYVGGMISRQAAIAIADDLKDDLPDDDRMANAVMAHNEGIAEYQTALSLLPSVQPERKKGEWIPGFDGKFTGGAYWFSCSKCKRIVPEVRNGGWNFCPNCGADMRGEQDEM